jgi:hypothetical protein
MSLAPRPSTRNWVGIATIHHPLRRLVSNLLLPTRNSPHGAAVNGKTGNGQRAPVKQLDFARKLAGQIEASGPAVWQSRPGRMFGVPELTVQAGWKQASSPAQLDSFTEIKAGAAKCVLTLIGPGKENDAYAHRKIGN